MVKENNINTEGLKASIKEEKPSYKRGDIVTVNKVEVTIRNVYSRKLEDLTFSDLEMMGYTNPNLFVREWISKNGSFDRGKVVWVVVYMEDV